MGNITYERIKFLLARGHHRKQAKERAAAAEREKRQQASTAERERRKWWEEQQTFTANLKRTDPSYQLDLIGKRARQGEDRKKFEHDQWKRENERAGVEARRNFARWQGETILGEAQARQLPPEELRLRMEHALDKRRRGEEARRDKRDYQHRVRKQVTAGLTALERAVAERIAAAKQERTNQLNAQEKRLRIHNTKTRMVGQMVENLKIQYPFKGVKMNPTMTQETEEYAEWERNLWELAQEEIEKAGVVPPGPGEQNTASSPELERQLQQQQDAAKLREMLNDQQIESFRELVDDPAVSDSDREKIKYILELYEARLK